MAGRFEVVSYELGIDMRKKRGKRSSIPRDVKRRLLIKAGYCCSVRGCTVESALQFHHIDGNRDNSAFDNLLVLCSNHHTLATKGIIDRKACIEIKKSMSQDNANLHGLLQWKPELRRVFREEFERASFTRDPRKQMKNIFPSIFDRRHLFFTLKNLRGSPRDIYLSIKVLGELKYRGSTKVIIDAVEVLRKNTPKHRKHRFYYDFYFPAVEALSKIGTKRSLQWVAHELFKEDTDDPTGGIILFMALAGSKNARRHVGFRQISRTWWREGDKDACETIYRIQGKNYRVVNIG